MDASAFLGASALEEIIITNCPSLTIPSDKWGATNANIIQK